MVQITPAPAELPSEPGTLPMAPGGETPEPSQRSAAPVDPFLRNPDMPLYHLPYHELTAQEKASGQVGVLAAKAQLHEAQAN